MGIALSARLLRLSQLPVASPRRLYDGLISMNFTKLAKAHRYDRLGRYTDLASQAAHD